MRIVAMRAVRWILFVFVVLLTGCVGKRPFLMVQICLGGKHDVTLFKNMMKEIAQSQHMNYFDGSKSTQKDLEAMEVSPKYQIIDINIERADGVGFSAGNRGLSAYEVAIGFSEGKNPTEAHNLADLVIRILKQRWQVNIVPPNQGALPTKSCNKKSRVTISPSLSTEP